jgi:hypothetical protein
VPDEFVEVIRYLAGLGGFYGESDSDAVWCDMIAGAATDLAETSMQAAFQPTEDIVIAALCSRFEKFGLKSEICMAKSGSGFCVGVRITFSDVVLTEVLCAYLEWCPDIHGDTPLLDALHKRVSNDPGIASYLHSAQRYPKAGDSYVIDAARVLQRGLPSHISDANRFVSMPS